MQKKWKIMIILLTILIILYALTSCKEKIQEKKGNEDNWKVYQQLEEKEEQNIQNPFIREETKCILTEKEKQELRCTFRINGAPFPRQRCKRLAPAVRYPFVVTC